MLWVNQINTFVSTLGGSWGNASSVKKETVKGQLLGKFAESKGFTSHENGYR